MRDNALNNGSTFDIQQIISVIDTKYMSYVNTHFISNTHLKKNSMFKKLF